MKPMARGSCKYSISLNRTDFGLDFCTPMAYQISMTDRLTVVETPAYLSKAERIMSESECAAVLDTISRDPMAGVIVKSSGGLRKMRFGLEGRGKRGGGRVVYWFHSSSYPAVLLWAFAKNEASDMSASQLKRVKAVADALLEEFGAKT